MYQYYNPNPSNQRVGDCAVRAIAKATDQSWENAYINLVIEGTEASEAWAIINELMEILKRLQPKIYESVLNRLKK